jgi:N-carbamoylputrescine amidase
VSELTVAALQLAFTDNVQENIQAVSVLVREAAGKGAKLILPPLSFSKAIISAGRQDEAHIPRSPCRRASASQRHAASLAAELEV